MAITRQDYKYVHNTLDMRSNKQSDGSLGVGSIVKNLLPELCQENIYNPNYTEYYGSDTKNKWLIPSVQTEIIKENRYFNTQDSYFIETTESTDRLEVKNNSNTTQWVNFSMQLPNGTTDAVATIAYSDTVLDIKSSYDKSSRTISGQVQCSANALALVLIKYSITRYTVITKIDSPINGEQILSFSVDNFNNKSITLENTKQEADSFVLTWCFNDSANYDTDRQEWVPNIDILKKHSINYKIIIEYDDASIDNPTQYGFLKTTTPLSSNKSYVLQIINQINVSSDESLKSSIYLSTDNKKFFDTYLFFNTGAAQERWVFEMLGVSFGYDIYDKQNTGVVVNLNPIQTSSQAKVFLFESDIPWMVDDKGKIVGLADKSLALFNTTKIDNTKKATLSESEVRKLFSTSPKIDWGRGPDEICIIPKEIDKYRTLWKQTLLNDKKEVNTDSFASKICLGVYRDHLVEWDHNYNKNKIKQRRGLLRNVFKRKNPPIPNLNGEPIKEIFYNINCFISFTAGEYDSIFIHRGESVDIEKNEVKSAEKTVYCKDSVDVSIETLSLLGDNYEYMLNKNLNLNTYKKYTSVCFAWGVKKGNDFERISDFSEPLFIDTSKTSISYNDQKVSISYNSETDLEYNAKHPYGAGWYYHELPQES